MSWPKKVLQAVLDFYKTWTFGTEQAVLVQAQRLLDDGASEDEVKYFFESHGFVQSEGEQK